MASLRLPIILLLVLGASVAALESQDSPFGRRKSKPSRKKSRKRENAVEEYQKKIETGAPSTAEEHLELARWCESSGLTSEARRHFEKALALDPGLEAAKKGLG